MGALPFTSELVAGDSSILACREQEVRAAASAHTTQATQAAGTTPNGFPALFRARSGPGSVAKTGPESRRDAVLPRYRLRTFRFLLLVGITVHFELTAQTVPTKQVRTQQQAWLGYFNQTRLSNRWGIWLDLHARRTDHFLDRWSTLIVRPGITYYVSDQIRLTAGYAYVRLYPAVAPIGDADPLVRPEHRLWQQVNWQSHYKRLHLNQWIRLEERNIHKTLGTELADGYTFNFRFRYMITVQVPLKGDTPKPGVPNFVLQDEIHINAGKQITYNYFDQNRFFVGLAYPFSKTFTAQLGYMNLYQQQASGNAFVNNHAIRLFLFHNLNLTKP
ncbi:hypothetical protein GCM10028803_36630 [Larkinella knui]|uniref:DUF2490 domain-containing protein n=2 Tax=Larkinella knui TaxID=2025310 RepID=A0A3P1CF91_9BACT|nr:DUF2490 domain-containing protein [Larkinella knui]